MTNSSDNTYCVSRLVNRFGDGHNHELNQFIDARDIITKVACESKRKVYLLGNIIVGQSSLDALLIGNFGFVILEFKSYKQFGSVRLTAQRQLVCYPKEGETGNAITVKGGNQTNGPLEQAWNNRNNTLNYLKECLKKDYGRATSLVILFPGDISIDGLENLKDNEKDWLYVKCETGLEHYLKLLLDNSHRRNILSKVEIEGLIEKMEANTNYLEDTDYFLQAFVLFRNNRFSEAFDLLDKKCDKTRVDAIILKLNCLYHLKSKDLISEAAAVMNSTDDNLRAEACELLGLANYYGRNGIKDPNYENAIEYLTKAQPIYDNSDIIEKINKIINEENKVKKNREKEERLNAARMENKEKKKVLREMAESIFKDNSRISSSVVFIIAASTLVSVLVPLSWIPAVLTTAIAAIIYMLRSLYKDDWDVDKWYIRKKHQAYIDVISIDTIKVDEYEMTLDNPRLKALAIGLLNIALPIALFYVTLMAVYSILHTEFILSFADTIFSNCKVNIITLIPLFMVIFFVIYMVPFILAIWHNICTSAKTMKDDGLQPEHYIIAIPKPIDMSKPRRIAAWSITFMVLKLSVGLTVALTVFGAVKPVLYELLSWLFDTSRQFSL